LFISEKQLEETSIKTQTIINTNNTIDKTNINLKLNWSKIILSLSVILLETFILVSQS